MQEYQSLNILPINRQATRLLSKTCWKHQLPAGLSVAALMRWAVDQGGIELPTTNDEAMGLLTRLEKKNPQKLMDLLTKTDSGNEIQQLLPKDPMEAAAQLWNDLLTAV